MLHILQLGKWFWIYTSSYITFVLIRIPARKQESSLRLQYFGNDSKRRSLLIESNVFLWLYRRGPRSLCVHRLTRAYRLRDNRSRRFQFPRYWKVTSIAFHLHIDLILRYLTGGWYRVVLTKEYLFYLKASILFPVMKRNFKESALRNHSLQFKEKCFVSVWFVEIKIH